ncbi:hypothetical protein SprV_0401708900 [Sparganum proliferum]
MPTLRLHLEPGQPNRPLISSAKNCLRCQKQPRAPTPNGGIVAQKFFSLHYMQETSEVITEQLNRFGIHNAHKPAYSLRAELSRVNERIPKEQQTDVIYRIPCSNFPIVSVRHLGGRLANQRDHRFNWNDTEVVAMANTKRARECIEARHSNAGSINRHVDPDAIMKACNDHSSLCPAPMPPQRLLT